MLAEDGQPSRETAWHQVRDALPEVIVFMPCGYYLEEAEDEVARVPRAAGVRRHAGGPQRQRVRGRRHVVSSRDPGPRIVDGLEILAWAAHPDSYPTPPDGTIAKLR